MFMRSVVASAGASGSFDAGPSRMYSPMSSTVTWVWVRVGWGWGRVGWGGAVVVAYFGAFAVVPVLYEGFDGVDLSLGRLVHGRAVLDVHPAPSPCSVVRYLDCLALALNEGPEHRLQFL